MNIWQKLAKYENQLQKSPPRQMFEDFGLILGSLGEPRNTKHQQKSKPKKQQNFRSQKNTNKSEKKTLI